MALAAKALSNGASVERRETGIAPAVLWRAAGNCESPVYTQLRYAAILGNRPAKITGGDFVSEISNVSTMEMEVRCRKCASCLRARSALWRRRAVTEWEQATRSWFATLTLNPAEQFKAISKARQRLADNGLDFEGLDKADRFAEIHRQSGPLVTAWLKRVRKNSGATLRYLCVVEPHKSGLPHYHLLIHEMGDTPVRHKVLAQAWPHGFTMFKLVEDKRVAWYVCKYLSKDLSARVRASIGYGALAPIASKRAITF